MNLTIRTATKADYIPTEILASKAFEDRSRLPGPLDEHALLYHIRQSKDNLQQLDLVAEADGVLVGQITCTRAHIKTEDTARQEVITIAPLCVLPQWQNKGVGSALMHTCLQKAKQAGYPAAVLFGHRAYYPRFGFKEATSFGLKPKQGKAIPEFMALELLPGALKAGVYVESDCLNIKPETVRQYEREIFPTYTQQ